MPHWTDKKRDMPEPGPLRRQWAASQGPWRCHRVTSRHLHQRHRGMQGHSRVRDTLKFAEEKKNLPTLAVGVMHSTDPEHHAVKRGKMNRRDISLVKQSRR